MHEMEDKWVTYDDEETEVQLEISDLIFDKLVTETAELIHQIQENRRGPKESDESRKQQLLAVKKQPEPKLRRKGSL